MCCKHSRGGHALLRALTVAVAADELSSRAMLRVDGLERSLVSSVAARDEHLAVATAQRRNVHPLAFRPTTRDRVRDRYQTEMHRLILDQPCRGTFAQLLVLLTKQTSLGRQCKCQHDGSFLLSTALRTQRAGPRPSLELHTRVISTPSLGSVSAVINSKRSCMLSWRVSVMGMVK